METKTIEKIQGLLNEAIERKNQKLAADMAEKLMQLQAEIQKAKDMLETKMKRPAVDAEKKTFSEAVRESLFERKAAIEQMERGQALRFEVKTTNVTFGSFTGKPSIDLRPDFVPRARRMNHVREILQLGSTSVGLVQIIRETAQNGNATPQVEGQAKAQVGYTYSVIDFPVQTIAAYVRTSRQALEDIEGLASFINSQLPAEILREEDNQFLNGTGTSPNLFGIFENAGSNASNTSLGPNLPSPQLWDVIARVMTGMLAKDEIPDFVLLNPVDFGAMLTAKGSNGQYVSPLIFDNGQPYVYGLPVYVNSAMAADKILVGNSLMAQPMYRQGLQLAISYEDGTNFRDNMVTIRAEERVANVIYRPSAFFKGDISGIISELTA